MALATMKSRSTRSMCCTIELHMADVEKLIRALRRLVDGGHSVVVIEQDHDVVAEADWVIDLRPEDGSGVGSW